MRTCAIVALLALCAVGRAHEVPVDWDAECMPPGGVGTGATGAFSPDGAGGYEFTAADDRGKVSYTVGLGAGGPGLFSVDCRAGDGPRFTFTRGLVIAGRDRLRREVMPDGTLRLSAFDVADVEADGPGGYMKEATGHSPCLRIGDTLPVPANSEGFFTVDLGMPPGRYLLGLRYMDDRDDSAKDATIRLKLGEKVLGEWNLTLNDDAWHERLFEADLVPGDVLRVEARTDDSNGHGGDFCRISHVLIRPPDGSDNPAIAAEVGGDTLVIRQGPRPALGLPGIRAELSLQGRTLRCRLSQEGDAAAPAGFSLVELLPGAELPGAQIVRVPYLREPVAKTADGLLLSAYTDRMRSHCTRTRTEGLVNSDEGEVSLFGPRVYLSNSADEFYPLQEDLYFTASPRLLDVLPTFPARQTTSGRRQISGRVVFDHWRMAAGDGLEEQLRLMHACGMEDLLVILHTWMHYGYDRRQPQFCPANPERWTDEQFRSAIAACREMGYRVAVHENYNHMDWDSPYNSPTPARQFGEPDRPGDPGPQEAQGLVTADPGPDLSRQPRNAWAFSRLADLRVSPGPLSRPSPPAFPVSSDKMLFYSQIESHRTHDTYGTTAGYLDVTPCNEPGIATWDTHIDLDARNREARGSDQVYRNAARLFAHHRDLLEISTGEGGSSATYHAGYIHAVERQVETRMQTPILPEHELRVIRPLSLHHGMGYYSRYFGDGQKELPEDYDLYRAMTLAFGHAGFIGDDIVAGHVPGPEAIREYHLVRPVQRAYADAELTAIEYWDGTARVSAEEGLQSGYDFIQARVRLRYDSGLELALNFDRDEPWETTVGGRAFNLPPKGWAAVCEPMGVLAYTAIVDGEVEDFARCPQYVYRNRRGEDDGVAAHTVYRARGLPGLSRRACPGVLVVLGERPLAQRVRLPPEAQVGPEVNVTVINPGPPREAAVAVEGFRSAAGCPATTLSNTSGRDIVREVSWEPKAPGRWRLALAYRYTDPDHSEEATRLEVRDEMTGPGLVVAEGGGPPTAARASSTRNADFVELRATVEYQSPVPPRGPVRLRIRELKVGSGTVDNDYVQDVRLLLTNEHSGQTVEVAFPPAPKLSTTRIDSFEQAFAFPENSVTTFELTAR